jgi:hypothetical protein
MGSKRRGGGGVKEDGRGGVGGRSSDLLVLGTSLRRSFGCRMRWDDWALARLSASTRKSELVGKPTR